MVSTNSAIQKIFGIGLPKTGNCSLAMFLRNNGLTGVRYPTAFQWRNLEPYQFIIDTPCNIYFRELSLMYPDAKFVLTHRNNSDWLVSWHNHTKQVKLKNRWQKYIRSQLYDKLPTQHLKNVDSFLTEYFLLDIDNLDIKGLCDFLELPLTTKYPHENVTI